MLFRSERIAKGLARDQPDACFVAMELSDLDAVMAIEQRVYTHPWSRASFTQVLVQPGNVEIPVGQDLVITNTFTGRPVAFDRW